ncbi:hypothetical protein ABT039_09525 [Streptomyces lasiicapitis]|uniref:hypothetical protein n=1 Tax=Streptomyces lasiicapitis TaxID=1923961 RepID=UPI003319D673
MDRKKMRRLCTRLLDDLHLSVPTDPPTLFAALCANLSKRHRQPVEHRLVSFPADTVSGLWMATSDRHFILVEADTSPEHQLVIFGHEVWHMEIDTGWNELLEADEANALLAPNVDAETVRTLATRVAARTTCDQQEEAACEMFGSLLGTRARLWLEDEHGTVPACSAEYVHRLDAALGSVTRPGGGR